MIKICWPRGKKGRNRRKFQKTAHELSTKLKKKPILDGCQIWLKQLVPEKEKWLYQYEKSVYRNFSINFNIHRKRETSVGVTRLFSLSNRVFLGRFLILPFLIPRLRWWHTCDFRAGKSRTHNNVITRFRTNKPQGDHHGALSLPCSFLFYFFYYNCNLFFNVSNDRAPVAHS